MKLSVALFAFLIWTLPASAGSVQIVTLEETRELALRENVVLIDNRAPELFQLGHLPKAVNLTYKEQGSEENVMTKDSLEPFRGKTLIFYCSGNMRAFHANNVAIEWGWKPETVFWFKDGFPVWAGRGLPIETTKMKEDRK